MNCLRGNASWKRILLVSMLAVMVSCSAGRRFVSTSDPETARLDGKTCLIEVSAIKKDFVHHNMFRLTVSNTGKTPISIDWNQSGWFINGKDGGKFVFAGINPPDIKENNVSDTIIPPGQSQKMEIAPLRLIAWVPLKYKTDRSGRSILPGMLPEGHHGIHLVMKQDGKIINETLNINIVHEPLQ